VARTRRIPAVYSILVDKEFSSLSCLRSFQKLSLILWSLAGSDAIEDLETVLIKQ